MSSSRNLLGIAVVLAFVAGLAQGFRPLVVPYLASTGMAVESLGTITAGLTVLVLVLDPFAVFALGYRWGQEANVPAACLGFGGRLFVATLLGFVVSYVATFLSIPTIQVDIVRTVTMSAATGIKTATNLALAALAASAIAHFRGRYRPSATDRETTHC